MVKLKHEKQDWLVFPRTTNLQHKLPSQPLACSHASFFDMTTKGSSKSS